MQLTMLNKSLYSFRIILCVRVCVFGVDGSSSQTFYSVNSEALQHHGGVFSPLLENKLSGHVL